MGKKVWKSYSGFFSYKEAVPFVEDSSAFHEARGRMMLPEPEYQLESDYNKLGSGEHGLKNELQSVFTPWSYTCDRLSEIAYMLSFFMGEDDSFAHVEATAAAWVHELKHLRVNARNMPTFTFEIGDGSNQVISGCIVNEFSIGFAAGGTGVVEATFSGFGNRHYVLAGDLTSIAAGSMSSGINSFASEPLLNYKSLRFYAADTMDALGKESIDFSGDDLGSNLLTLTPLLNSITITGNNGITGADLIRAGSDGVINDRTRGDRRFGLEFSLRRDNTIINTDVDRLADKQRAYELLFTGPNILSSYPYAMDLFFPVVQVGSAPEDDGNPINKAFTTEVFQDSNADSMLAYFQTGVGVGYNAIFS